MKHAFTLKFIGYSFLMIFGFSGLHAQSDGFNSEGRFGIRGGVLISKQNLEDDNLDEDAKSKLGLDLGILYTLPIGNGLFALQPELHWMQKGSTISDININGIDQEYTTTMNYLELPLLARINIGGSLKVFAFGGPSVGFLLDVNSDDDYFKKEDFEDTEFGLHLGAGVGIGTFEVDLRYIAGLSDVAESDGNLEEIKNSGFGAGLTLKF